MTNEIIGKIEELKLDSKIGRNDKPYKRWIFKIDGRNYSTFDETIGTNEDFQIGVVVKMQGEQKGEYWNMSTMELTDKISDVKQVIKPQTFLDRAEDANTLTLILKELRIMNNKNWSGWEKKGDDDGDSSKQKGKD